MDRRKPDFLKAVILKKQFAPSRGALGLAAASWALPPTGSNVCLRTLDSRGSLHAMALVVFFRAVNVGGHQKFQPSKLAKELAKFGVVNIGAAGTFVVRENVSQTELRAEILRRLPFKPELMICHARDVLALAQGNWFGNAPAEKGVGRFVSVLQKAPRVKPRLPIEQPAGDKWEVRIVAITGRFALSVRRLGQTYSNAVVEKHVRVPATTRNWNTIEAIRGILEKQSDAQA